VIILYVLLTCCAVLSYGALIIYILNQWKVEPTPDNDLVTPQNFSVIIPARNEADNIVICLKSVLTSVQNYAGEIEIIVIDDYSEDDTFELVTKHLGSEVKIFKLSLSDINEVNAFKKAAINFGLSKASYKHIIQFDADVTIGSSYFETVNQFLQRTESAFTAAPVCFTPASGLLQSFQTLDMMGMMAVTNAGIRTGRWYMANGANMIYKKSDEKFDTSHLASGDDVYKIQSVAERDGALVHFLLNENAVVNTAPEDDFKSLVQQRLRWATKNKLMKSKTMQMMMAIPFLNAWVLIFHLLLIFYFGMTAFVLCVFHWSIKIGIDYVYLKKLNHFFKQKIAMKYFLPANVLHVIYIAIIGLLSMFVKNYNWKGRSVR